LLLFKKQIGGVALQKLEIVVRVNVPMLGLIQLLDNNYLGHMLHLIVKLQLIVKKH
jgi:hypothetical protein